MRITYLEHCGFIVELNKHTLIFDPNSKLSITNQEVPQYLFLSHQDALARAQILRPCLPRACMVLVDDAAQGIKEMNPCVCLPMQGEQLVDDIRVTTLSGTKGCAYLLELEGKVLYHGGGLHWWHWEEEQDEATQAQVRQDYLHAISALAGRTIDVAFLRMDPRQNDQFYYGAHALMERCDIHSIIPMGMQGVYSLVEECKDLEVMAPYRDRIIALHHPIEQIIL